MRTIGLLLILLLCLQTRINAKGIPIASRIDNYVKQQLKEANIPGLSVTVIDGDRLLFRKEYGYSDLSRKIPVSANTLFEIGSNSKAFTALGILYLEKRGLLNLNDPVTKYLPWLKLPFTDENKRSINPVIKIKNLFYHTSGIPFNSIDLFQEGSSDKDLERTIKRLRGTKLDFLPGEKYQYATINYDILGLIIQEVSGKTYEDFMMENILRPLGLENTVLFRSAAKFTIASGYKYSFFRLKEYKAPVYRGNTPAGYILSNSKDLERWLKYQLLVIRDSTYTPLILKSHIPDQISRGNAENTFYAGGWLVYNVNESLIKHNGNNPNFSSSIVLDNGRKLGIVILANINSDYTEQIAQGIQNLLSGKNIKKSEQDTYKNIDRLSFFVLLIAIIFSISTLVFLFLLLKDIILKKRIFYVSTFKTNSIKILCALLFLGGLTYCLYMIPKTIYHGLSWDFLKVWAPESLCISIEILYISFILFLVYFFLDMIVLKMHEGSIYSMTILALLSGTGNAIIIYSINAALDSRNQSILSFLPYFIFGLFIYLSTQRLLSENVISLTNGKLYTIKKELINKILTVPFHRFERIPKENFLVVLNNDANEVSQFPAAIVQMATGIVTLTCCFIYLGIINIWGLAISGAAIFIVGLFYYKKSQSAKKIWNESLEIQNKLMKFIDDMSRGFKELKLNILKKLEFERDFDRSNEQYRNKSIKAQLKFANVFVIGELFFSSIFCVVIFIFPFIFKEIEKNEMKTFVLVFLYMTGPINIILSTFPNLTRIIVSWNRIEQFRKHFSPNDAGDSELLFRYSNDNIQNILKFDLIEYSYHTDTSKEGFKIGPVSCYFQSGEVVFITGSNGSGKSTLAKILTGLYAFDIGSVTLNDKLIDSFSLTQKFTAIFSDFHLFNKLYGIDYVEKATLLHDKLKKLKLDTKLKIQDGIFNTLSLSTGQRKRMALLVSYLEDKPFYLFDEWAADQDVEFRAFFYNHLLPELKMAGKIVIVISHDDRYFNTADRVYDMRLGKLVEVHV